jgi:hypothetical protein
MRILIGVGGAAMLAGALDPLQGSLVVLPGSALVALGALIGGSPHRRMLRGAFNLVAVGVGALWILSALGGVGGESDRSSWWLRAVLPYPAGWVLGLIGGVRAWRASEVTSR